MNIGLKIYKDIENAVKGVQRKIRVLEDTFLSKEDAEEVVIGITQPIVTSVETLNSVVANMQSEIDNLKQTLEDITNKAE